MSLTSEETIYNLAKRKFKKLHHLLQDFKVMYMTIL